jgi:hypothetical protein
LTREEIFTHKTGLKKLFADAGLDGEHPFLG